MNKLKQVFGGKKDEETTNAATGETVEPEKRSSSITRQILNPGGNKYDEQIHGTTSTATPGVPHPEQLRADPNVKMQTQPEKEKGQMGRQMLNPNGDKYDEERHGITSVPQTGHGSSGAPPEYVDHTSVPQTGHGGSVASPEFIDQRSGAAGDGGTGGKPDFWAEDDEGRRM